MILTELILIQRLQHDLRPHQLVAVYERDSHLTKALLAVELAGWLLRAGRIHH